MSSHRRWHSVLLAILSGERAPGTSPLLDIDPTEAHRVLVTTYGVDFGTDTRARRDWIEQRRSPAFERGVRQLAPALLATFNPQHAPSRYDRETAYRMLVKAFGVDFGADAAKWQAWLDAHPTAAESK